MANLSQTAADVGLKSAGSVSVVQAGEAITQGQPVYLSSSKYYKASASTAVTALVAGIAVTSAATDEYLVIQTAGNIDLGATLAVGMTYVASATSGAIAPVSDITTGDFVTHLGIALTASTMQMDISPSGTASA